MLYIIGIFALLFIIHRYRLQEAGAGSSEYMLYLLVSLLITCLSSAYRILN